MFEGFALDRIDVGEVVLRVRHGGTGSPVLLLHGHPRTHATWHRVAALLAPHFTVVAPDLRGYGESTTPATQPDHSQASKRAMAGDNLALMRALGHERFAVVGHDRGSYAALRLALDHPEAVTHLAVLDGVPIGEALARADARFATMWWHWFFFGQPDKPERAIGADPDAWYGNGPDKAAQMGEEAYADYLRAVHDPDTRHSMIEDYRAGLGIDRKHDDADRAAGRTVACPTFVGWASADDMETLYGDPLDVWRAWAPDLSGRSFDCGHHIAEEAPDELVLALLLFLPVSDDDSVGLDLERVDLEGIASALDDRGDYFTFYFEELTGEVIPDAEDLDDDERDPRLIDADADHPELVPIGHRSSRSSYAAMENFANRVLDERLRLRLTRALTGSGAFRRFRGVVMSSAVSYSWHDYRNYIERNDAIDWLLDHDLVSDVAAARYREAHPEPDLPGLEPRD